MSSSKDWILITTAQRHKAYWGEDAHLFDPERFLDERMNKYVTSNPFVFIPFNVRQRIVHEPPYPQSFGMPDEYQSVLADNLPIDKPPVTLSVCFSTTTG